MKKLLLIICVLTSLLVGCSYERPESPIGKALSGTHELRKFKVVNKTKSKISGQYFLLAGSINGETTQETKILFSFKLPNGDYGMGELRMDEIRVHIDSTITTPYVKFRWVYGEYGASMRQIMNHVVYMVVYCKEEDFPYDVKLNQL